MQGWEPEKRNPQTQKNWAQNGGPGRVGEKIPSLATIFFLSSLSLKGPFVEFWWCLKHPPGPDCRVKPPRPRSPGPHHSLAGSCHPPQLDGLHNRKWNIPEARREPTRMKMSESPSFSNKGNKELHVMRKAAAPRLAFRKQSENSSTSSWSGSQTSKRRNFQGPALRCSFQSLPGGAGNPCVASLEWSLF